MKNDNTKKVDNLLQKKIKNSINQFEECKILTSRIQSSTTKTDQYRKDLLKQIEDKNAMKQRQEQEKAKEDQKLDNKIIQQRLQMYLEYLEEQKKADFITKKFMTSIELKNQNQIRKQSLSSSRSSSSLQIYDNKINTNFDKHGNVMNNRELEKEIEKNDKNCKIEFNECKGNVLVVQLKIVKKIILFIFYQI